jgi:signal transduction histidine kinase
LVRLPALLEGCRSAGLTIALDVDGEPRDLPPGIDLTAYRIIQEALTNVTKYSATRSASLHLAYSSTRLIITVTNETRGEASRTEPHGYGIIGMRERAQSVGGDLLVSQRTGRFELVSSLPLHLRTRTSREPAPQETTP